MRYFREEYEALLADRGSAGETMDR
jgi:hypothetical protein